MTTIAPPSPDLLDQPPAAPASAPLVADPQHVSGSGRDRPRRTGLRRVAFGATGPSWERPALFGLLIATAVLYFVNLEASGTANSFYAAAVQAGSQSWKAWFFGSLDSSNFITVDKPPASLWIMGLSARILGFSSLSLLAPQALMAVAAVALVWATVRRSLARLGRPVATAGGLLGGVALALTPAAALMFRFDNPDALLTLLMTVAAYSVMRALPTAAWRWLALAGVALGVAFLTKMLQGLLVLPAFGLVYLLAAPTNLGRRLLHLLVAAGALVVAAGWWVLAVTLWPASARPYIGGSTNNTELNLVFGYNGFGRIFGGSGNGGGGGGGTSGSSFGGATGLQRLFSSEMGLEISWLLPAALLALVLGLVLTRRQRRVDAVRAGFVVWGGWLLVTGLVFSYMSGTVHPYYTVALAPAIAALVGMGGALLWTRRGTWLGCAGLAGMIAVSGVWAFVLLGENATWLPALRWVLLVVAVASAVGVLLVPLLATPAGATLLAVVLLTGTLSALGGSGAYAVATVSVGHTGSIPTVGSVSTSSGLGGGTGMGGAPTGTARSGTGGSAPSGAASGIAPTGTRPTGTGAVGTRPTGSGSTGSGSTGSGSTGTGSAVGGARTGGGATSSAALTALLKATGTKWSAAVDGSQSAATLELASGTAVMAIGGWSSDPTPTLAAFEADVRAGRVHYYIAASQGGGGGQGGNTSSAILAWVKAYATATTVGGSTVYDLTKLSS